MTGWDFVEDDAERKEMTEYELYMIDLEAYSQMVMKMLYGVLEYDEARLHLWLQKLQTLTMSRFTIDAWKEEFRELQIQKKVPNGRV